MSSIWRPPIFTLDMFFLKLQPSFFFNSSYWRYTPPTFNDRIPNKGYIDPYYYFDAHPLLIGKKPWEFRPFSPGTWSHNDDIYHPNHRGKHPLDNSSCLASPVRHLVKAWSLSVSEKRGSGLFLSGRMCVFFLARNCCFPLLWLSFSVKK